MVKYRAQIESVHPLEHDLLRLRQPLLPEDILSWSRNKAAFDRIDEEGVEQENKKLARRLGKKKAAEVRREMDSRWHEEVLLVFALRRCSCNAPSHPPILA